MIWKVCNIFLASTLGFLAWRIQYAHAEAGDAVKVISCVVGESGNDCKTDIDRMLNAYSAMLGGYGTDVKPANEELKDIIGDPSEMTRMCADINGTKGCITRFHEQANDYYSMLQANTATSTACNRSSGEGGSSASALVGLISVTTDFFCLANEEDKPCAFAVADAIHVSGLDSLVTANLLDKGGGSGSASQQPQLDAGQLEKTCNAFNNAGCCAKSFFQFVPLLAKMLCQEFKTLETLFRLLPELCKVPGISVHLPPSCPEWDASSYSQLIPQVCPTSTTFWSDMSGGCERETAESCPTDMCEFGCLSSKTLASLQVQGQVSAPPDGNPADASPVASDPLSEEHRGSGGKGGTDTEGVMIAIVAVSCVAVLLIGVGTLVAARHVKNWRSVIRRTPFDPFVDDITEIPMTNLGENSVIEAAPEEDSINP